jgi:hypothetical protein
MAEQDPPTPSLIVVGPEDDAGKDAVPASETVEQPAKVMRIGSMIKQLLEEVRLAPLDDASRTRLAEVYEQSIRELAEGLSPDLRDELARLALPLDAPGHRVTPSCASPRHSWSAGWRVFSTASRRPCLPSRWPPRASSSKCAGEDCPLVTPRGRPVKAGAAVPAPTSERFGPPARDRARGVAGPSATAPRRSPSRSADVRHGGGRPALP